MRRVLKRLLTYPRSLMIIPKGDYCKDEMQLNNKFRFAHMNDDSKIGESESLMSLDLMEEDKKIKTASERKKLKFNIQGELVYGIHPVQLALQSRRREFYQLYINKKLSSVSNNPRKNIQQQAMDLGIPIKQVRRRMLENLCKGHLHQGVCLDAGKLKMAKLEEEEINFRLKEDLPVKWPPFWLVLDQIQDPMNFGAVLRSSYYFGVDKILSVIDSSSKLTPVVSKASSGAMEILPVYEIHNLSVFLQSKKEQGWTIVGTQAYSTLSDSRCIGINHFQLTKPTIFILGNEGKGISQNIYDLCNEIVTIYPRRSGLDALNVSVVCGIILHTILGQRSPIDL